MSTAKEVHIISVERIDGTELLVEFSDGTCASFTTERLMEMAPHRSRAEIGPDATRATSI